MYATRLRVGDVLPVVMVAGVRSDDEMGTAKESNGGGAEKAPGWSFNGG